MDVIAIAVSHVMYAVIYLIFTKLCLMSLDLIIFCTKCQPGFDMEGQHAALHFLRCF